VKIELGKVYETDAIGKFTVIDDGTGLVLETFAGIKVHETEGDLDKIFDAVDAATEN